MNKQYIKDTVEIAVKNQAGVVVNEYIKYYNCKVEQFDIKHLDLMWLYVIHLHNSGEVDIFCYNDKSLFTILFLV